MKNAVGWSLSNPLAQSAVAGILFSVALVAGACSNDESDGADENADGDTATADDVGSSGGARSTRTGTGGATRSSTGGSAGISSGIGGRGVAVAGSSATGISVAGASGAPVLAPGVAGARVATGVAGAGSLDVTCVSARACTTGCTAPCPGETGASYSCSCTDGRLDCDVAVCVVGTTTCETGRTCTKDCSGACPTDSSKTYTCSCDNERLDCDVSACVSITLDGQCPVTNSDGVACNSDIEDFCTPPANSSELLCMCSFSNEWMCI